MPDADFPYRFRDYERVRIVGERPSLDPVRGELAAVLGRAANDEGASYAVHVYSEGLCWSVDEADLEPTGTFDRRETFHDDAQPSLRVSPDGDVLGWSRPDERRPPAVGPSEGEAQAPTSNTNLNPPP